MRNMSLYVPQSYMDKMLTHAVVSVSKSERLSMYFTNKGMATHAFRGNTLVVHVWRQMISS